MPERTQNTITQEHSIHMADNTDGRSDDESDKEGDIRDDK
jgi:hypothetical protein